MACLDRFGTMWGWLLVLPWTAPVLAHTTEISGDVAATFHIEPNHNPKAGQPAKAWFVLTQRGGKVVPLAKCQCSLKVYLNPRLENGAPTSEPVLKSTSTAQYQDIPGAEITFAKPGEYALEISGTPQADAQFQPFKLSYEVTVTAGKTTPQIATAPKQSSQNPTAQSPSLPASVLQMNEHPQSISASIWIKAIVTGVSIVALVTLAIYTLNRKKP
jgi:hypothetical protein